MATSKATTIKRVNVAELFNQSPLTSYQIGVCVLCLGVTLLDGFDNQVIGLAAPKIAQMLRLTPQSLGVVFSAAHFGVMIGALGFGTLADRWGRKRMLVLSALIFGVFTLLTTQITTVQQLALCRFLSGIGLGGAVPNALAFGAEYAPNRLRASLATLMWVGLPGGGVLAGFAAAYILPKYGWQRLFWMGGITPLVIVVLVLFLLPESLAFLVRQGRDTAQIQRIVRRISPAVAENTQFYTTEKKLPGVPVKHLFSEGRALTTLLLWLLFFLSFFLLIFLVSWNPTLLRRSGASVQQSSLAFSLFNFGSVLATLAIGRIMDRFNSYWMLMATFVASALTVAAFGALASMPFAIVATLSIVTGIFVCGANSGLMALAAISYPVAVRGTGIGWAYAIGRFGAMSGPLVGGLLLARSWNVGQVCAAVGFTGVIAATAIMVLKKYSARVEARRGEETAAVPAD